MPSSTCSRAGRPDRAARSTAWPAGWGCPRPRDRAPVEPRAHGAHPHGARRPRADPGRVALRGQPGAHAPPVGALPRRPHRRAGRGVARAGGAHGAHPVGGAGRRARGAAGASELGSARRPDSRCVGRAPAGSRRQPGRGRSRPDRRDRAPGGRAARDVRRAARRRPRPRGAAWRSSGGTQGASGSAPATRVDAGPRREPQRQRAEARRGRARGAGVDDAGRGPHRRAGAGGGDLARRARGPSGAGSSTSDWCAARRLPPASRAPRATRWPTRFAAPWSPFAAVRRPGSQSSPRPIGPWR